MSEQGEGQPQQQPQEQKDLRVPAENPSYKAFMEKRDATIAAREAESAPQIIEASPTEGAPKVSRERTPEAELTTNQERIKNNLGNNIDLFLEGKADAVDFSPAGAMVPSEKGKVIAENLSRLIRREAAGNLGDVETAAKRLRRDYNKQIRDAETPIRQQVKKTLKAAGAEYDVKMVDKAAKGLSSIQTSEIRAKMTMLDTVVKKERAEARKAAAEARKIAVKDIASKLTSDEIDVFKRDLAREGKKVPASSALLKNMLAQKINAGYSIDPIAIKSVKMDNLIRDAQAKQAEAIPPQSQAEPAEDGVANPALEKQAEGFIPGLSDSDVAELQKQNAMSPEDRAVYKAAEVSKAEEEAFNANRPEDAWIGETFADYKERTKIPAEQQEKKAPTVGGFVSGLTTADTEEIQKQNKMTLEERAAYKADAVSNAEEEAFNANRPEDAMIGETFAQYRERTKVVEQPQEPKPAEVGGFIPGLSTVDTEELQRQNRMTPDAREEYKANAVAQAEQQASGISPEPQELTALEQARAEIQRIQNGGSMRDDLPEEVRNHVIEQMYADHETGNTPPTQATPERQQEAPGQAIKAVVIDFEQRKQELMEKQDKSKFGKLKSWGRKAAAAAIIVGAVLGATRADGNNDSFADQAPIAPHTQTVDSAPPSSESPFNVVQDNGSSDQDSKEPNKQEIVTAQVQEGEGLTQVLKRINGNFDNENPSDWEKVGEMLKLNEDALRDKNPELYSKIDQAKQQQMAATGNDVLSGEKIKELIREGGENYPVLTFTGQELKTPSTTQATT